MDFNQKRILGRTGLRVGCLGVGSSYDTPAEAYEEAFERGVNYKNPFVVVHPAPSFRSPLPSFGRRGVLLILFRLGYHKIFRKSKHFLSCFLRKHDAC